MNEVFLIELEKRKTDPKNDLITSLYQASQAEGALALSLDEILAQLQLIIIAGHDTTANTMTLSMEAFSRRPEALHYIRDNPDDIERCVAEMQRYVAMSAGQTRVASSDFELRGRLIRQGELVTGAIVAADRDPLKFDRPHELDLTRHTAEMMVFAPGPRSCIGHMLAKMQLAEFFTALARRVDRVEVLDPEIAWMPVFVFRGLYNLNVRVHPRDGF
jgi:cytochrome P450